MSQPRIYHIYVTNRTPSEVRELIQAHPSNNLDYREYAEGGFTTSDVKRARALKHALDDCLHYAYQTERASRRTTTGRHITATLDNEWIDVRTVIEPNPDAAHLMR
jgi:hypothetical protein